VNMFLVGASLWGHPSTATLWGVLVMGVVVMMVMAMVKVMVMVI